MSLLLILIVLVCVGVILWLVNTYIPMQPDFKRFLNIAAIVLTAIWILSKLGVFAMLAKVEV